MAKRRERSDEHKARNAEAARERIHRSSANRMPALGLVGRKHPAGKTTAIDKNYASRLERLT
jgi:hypothetical protein